MVELLVKQVVDPQPDKHPSRVARREPGHAHDTSRSAWTAIQTWTLAALLSLSCLPASACLDLDFDADLLTLEHLNNSRSVNPGDFFYDKTPAYFQERADHWQAEWKAHGQWRDRSRYAVCLAFLEEYDAALKELLAIDAAHPGQYAVAMNIATVYEQLGKFDKALKWIEKAITLDAGNHAGTERIHLNVLRIEAAGEQATCTSQDLIGIDFGDAPAPATTQDAQALADLQADIFRLLDQRVYLNAEPDPCAARLLFELGNLNYLASFPTASLMNYDLAEEWGFEGALLEARKGSVTGANYDQPPPTDADSFYRAQGLKPAAQGERWTASDVFNFAASHAFLIALQLLLLIYSIRMRRNRKKRPPRKARKQDQEFYDLFVDGE